LLERFANYEWLHLIDLDAATGKGSNRALIHSLCRSAHRRYKLKLRVGGGIRTVVRARIVLGLGPVQVIVPSTAFRGGALDFAFLRRLRKAVSRKRIVIALDTEKGRVTINGWRQSLPLRAQDVFAKLEPFCTAFLCTDVDQEGTMAGANLTWFRKLRAAT